MLKDIYKVIAGKNNLTVKQVEEIAISQFMLIKKTMVEGVKNKPETFKSLQLTHLGKFAIRKYKLEEYKRKANEK
tara:strand:- start:21536 stop:21760 length:225 start_codon:yes stop_codon:yes gene_type:complete